MTVVLLVNADKLTLEILYESSHIAEHSTIRVIA